MNIAIVRDVGLVEKPGGVMRDKDVAVIDAVRTWVDKAVIGLNLCPFAKAVQVKQQIRYVVSHATDEIALAADLLEELRLLQSADRQQLETTLLIVPDMLADFLDFNDFLEIADATAAEDEFADAFQVAAFHPLWQFADTEPEDVGNYTNRSPYPVLHVLREDSLDEAIAAYSDPSDIYERNIRTLQTLGVGGWRKLFAD